MKLSSPISFPIFTGGDNRVNLTDVSGLILGIFPRRTFFFSIAHRSVECGSCSSLVISLALVSGSASAAIYTDYQRSCEEHTSLHVLQLWTRMRVCFCVPAVYWAQHRNFPAEKWTHQLTCKTPSQLPFCKASEIDAVTSRCDQQFLDLLALQRTCLCSF